MSTFLSFIGILAIVLFIKFLYDTYVKGKRYTPDGQLIPNQDVSAEFEYLQNIEKARQKEKYLNKLKSQNLDLIQLRHVIDTWSKKKVEEAKQEGISIEETYAWYAEQWTKEYYKEVEEEAEADFWKKKYGDME